MSRAKSALEGAAAFVARQASAFWSLQINPALDEAEERDPVASAERESFFWRAERRQPAW
jgi:hypothetical protein